MFFLNDVDKFIENLSKVSKFFRLGYFCTTLLRLELVLYEIEFVSLEKLRLAWVVLVIIRISFNNFLLFFAQFDLNTLEPTKGDLQLLFWRLSAGLCNHFSNFIPGEASICYVFFSSICINRVPGSPCNTRIWRVRFSECMIDNTEWLAELRPDENGSKLKIKSIQNFETWLNWSHRSTSQPRFIEWQASGIEKLRSEVRRNVNCCFWLVFQEALTARISSTSARSWVRVPGVKMVLMNIQL